MIRLRLNDVFDKTMDAAYGTSLSTVWANFSGFFEDAGCDISTEENLKYRQQIFIEMLSKLLKEERLKFNKLGTDEIISLPIEDQLKLIEDSWPLYNSGDDNDDLDDIGLWFWVKCPVEIVWICEDGSYIWT